MIEVYRAKFGEITIELIVFRGIIKKQDFYDERGIYIGSGNPGLIGQRITNINTYQFEKVKLSEVDDQALMEEL